MKATYKDGIVSVDFEGIKGFATKGVEALQDFIDQLQDVKIQMKKDQMKSKKNKEKKLEV
jgi:hypothetical protein